MTERFAGPDGKVVHAMVEVGSGAAAVRVAVKEGDHTHPRFGFVLPAVLVHGVVTVRFSGRRPGRCRAG